jgi:glycosyltransferase involved in cell wall biosynthesis
VFIDKKQIDFRENDRQLHGGNKMINILYLHGGAELYGADVVLLELLKGLDKTLFKPYVILPNDGPLVEELKKNDIEVEVYPYPILRRQYFTPTGLMCYIKGFFKAKKYLEKVCVKNDIHIIHSNTAAVLEGLFLKKAKKIKHVWHIHEMIDSPKIIYKFLSYLISNKSDYVVAVSNSVKSHWEKENQFKSDYFKVIHNGIDNCRFNPHNQTDYLRKELCIESNDLIVGMIGRVNAIKGQGTFIKAMEHVIEKKNNTKAILVGGVFEGQEWRYKELEEEIKKSKFSSNFIIMDFRKDVENLHCLFDVFVLPSIGNDSFPTVVLEAMASGTPVVGFNSGGISEMIEHSSNGFFATFGEEDSLAEKILELLEDSELRDSISSFNVEKQKKCFSVESFINKFENFYRSII